MNVSDFKRMKAASQKIAMTTCYDYWSACILNESKIDALLVGDSAAMVMHGHSSTISATTDVMVYHTASVARGARDKFIISDLPFMSYCKGLVPAMETVDVLMKAGANAVKLEGVEGLQDLIKQIVQSGAPVMGHLGLMPQSVNRLGGYKVQGRGSEAQTLLIHQAKQLENAGCFAVVLECVPSTVGQTISHHVNIPTIGIGAGRHVDGQVLVLHDLMGFNRDPKKFVREFTNGFEIVRSAANKFTEVVKDGTFPSNSNSYE